MIKLFILIFILFASNSSSAQTSENNTFTTNKNAQKVQKNQILILNSYHQGMPWFQNIKKGLFSVLKPQENDVTIHIEDMDTKRFYNEEYLENLKNVYKLKYKNSNFDLILSTDNSAYEFLKDYKKELFGETPVVFAGLNNYENIRIDERDYYTGVLEYHSFEKNIELMMRLHPNSKKIYVLNDYLKTGLEVKKNIKNVINKMNYDI